MIKLKVTGPITFAGTSEGQTFLVMALVESGKQPAFANYIKTFYNISGATAFTDKEVSYTPTKDCYLYVEGRWHSNENLNIDLYTNLFPQVEKNKEDIALLETQVGNLPSSIIGTVTNQQNLIHRGTAKIIHAGSINFNNTEHKVVIPSVILANPANLTRLTIPAIEVNYNFRVGDTSAVWLVYNLSETTYQFISAGTSIANQIVIAALTIDGSSQVTPNTSKVLAVVWSAIQNWTIDGINNKTEIASLKLLMRGKLNAVNGSKLDFDNQNKKVSISSLFLSNPSGTSRLTIPAAEIDYGVQQSISSNYWLCYNVKNEAYRFVMSGASSIDDIIIAGFEVEGNGITNGVVKRIYWSICNIYCKIDGISTYTRLEDTECKVSETFGVLDISYIEPVTTVAKGTIYNGSLQTANVYANLAHPEFIKVSPNSRIKIIHAEDISIRLTQYSNNTEASFIKQTSYSKFDELILDSNTKYIRISAGYSERGFNQSNPVSVSDFQEGDFSVKVYRSAKISEIDGTLYNLIVDEYPDKYYFVDASTWTLDASGRYRVKIIPVTGGGKLICTAREGYPARIAFLNSFDEAYILANAPCAVDGTGNQNTAAGQTRIYDIPSTCNYIALNVRYGGSVTLPVSLIINGTEYMDNLENRLLYTEKTLSQATGDIDFLNQALDKNYQAAEFSTIVRGTLWNGSPDTGVNNCLYEAEYIEVVGGSKILCIHTNVVNIRVAEYDANKSFIKQSGYGKLSDIRLDNNTRYVRVCGQYLDDTYTSENRITPEHYQVGDFGFYYSRVKTVERITKLESQVKGLEVGSFESIIGRNIHKDAAVRATGAKAVSADIKPFSFIHISDIHTKGDNYKCFENALEFYQHYNSIKAMIVTGDIVWDTYHDPTTWYDEALAKTTKPVLNVIGNHDAGQYNATYGLDSQSSDLECYNKFIAPYVNTGTLPNGVSVPGWDVVQPTNAATEGKSYYYKDYTDEKIRLIVLCEFETDYEINSGGTGLVYNRETRAMRQAQFDWLIATLSSTPDDYGVIVAYHQPDNLIDEHNEFVSFDLVDDYRLSHGVDHIANIYAQSDTGRNALPAILNAFKNKSALDFTFYCNGAVPGNRTIQCDFTNVQAEFICILNGHTHKDYIGHLKDFPSIPVLVVGADNLKYTSGFQPRQEGTPSEDLFNVVNIDRNRKTIKIIRIGSDASVTGQVRDQMIMSYATT